MYYVSVGINLTGSDKPCISKHGTCQDNSQSCNGEYQSSLCAGAASRQCCVPASAGILTSHSQLFYTTIFGVCVSTWYSCAFHVNE